MDVQRTDERRSISLVVFDGDDTLWYGLDGGYVSGVDYQDAGRDDYTFELRDALNIQRNDGQRFRLYSEAPALLAELARRGTLISLASYNHRAPTLKAMQAFGVLHYFQHPTIEWSSEKDRMLANILQRFSQDGYAVSPETTLFIDDDLSGRYRQQMAKMGVAFLQKGVDLDDLSLLLDHPLFALRPARRG
jgi:HAD superfamily phosphatase (TIGR01681 family)